MVSCLSKRMHSYPLIYESVIKSNVTEMPKVTRERTRRCARYELETAADSDSKRHAPAPLPSSLSPALRVYLSVFGLGRVTSRSAEIGLSFFFFVSAVSNLAGVK